MADQELIIKDDGELEACKATIRSYHFYRSMRERRDKNPQGPQ